MLIFWGSAPTVILEVQPFPHVLRNLLYPRKAHWQRAFNLIGSIDMVEDGTNMGFQNPPPPRFVLSVQKAFFQRSRRPSLFVLPRSSVEEATAAMNALDGKPVMKGSPLVVRYL